MSVQEKWNFKLISVFDYSFQVQKFWTTITTRELLLIYMISYCFLIPVVLGIKLQLVFNIIHIFFISFDCMEQPGGGSCYVWVWD